MPDHDPRQHDETVYPEVRDDRLCDRFEFLLKAGQGVEVNDFLKAEGLNPADHPDLAAHLGRVEAHYRADGETRGFAAASVGGPADLQPGMVFDGRYTLIKNIGGGGMGEVWAAQQERPVKRLVAVKVIKPGMDSRAVLARFDAERQALAVMDHTNIAKVYDAGTTPAGRPYFVMELVKGVSITKFCDTHTLTPKQRMALFVTVCEAIQHAHLKGIIHRDIKPSNVMVAMTDGRPVVKVIDFGIAKAIGDPLSEHTFATGQGAVVGTPEYMSPEQAGLNQQDVDTRSDVYSLGVLLYELLTGTTPIDRKSLKKAALAEVLRLVRELDAPRPSDKLSSSAHLPSIAATRGTEPKKLTSEFRGEVDWILLRALEKDRRRRYESANALAADVQRHLNNEVVGARPPTTGYKVRKFVRRNRGPVAAAAAVFVALLGGVVGTTLGLIEAKRGRDDAIESRGKEKLRADGEREAKEDALQARKATDVQLWRAQLNEARANTRSRLVGQRFNSLATLRTALVTAERVGLSADDRKLFRDVATAALALPDVEEEKAWAGYPAGTHHHVIDGKFERYARTDPEGNASVRRVSDDVELYSFPLGGLPKAVTLSPSGRILVISDNAGPEEKRVGRVYRLDGPEPEKLTELTVLFGPNVFVTPDDEQVVFSTRTSVGVWEVKTREKREWPLPGPQHGHASLSRDGRRVAYSISQGKSLIVRVLEVETGRVVADLPLSGTTDALAFHPNGRIVAVASQKKIHIWDVEAKRLLRTLDGHTNGGVIPAFDSTGERLVSNDWSGILRVWDWRAGRQLLTTSPVSGPFAATLSADDRLLTLAPGTDRLKILRLHAGLEQRSFAALLAPIKWMHTDPGGRFAVVTQLKENDNGRPYVVDPTTGDELARLPTVGAGQRAFHVAADGAILTNGHSGINRWPLATTPDAGLLLFAPMHTVRVGYTTDTHTARADGRVVAMPAYSSGAYVFHADRPQTPVRCGPQHDVRNVAASPDGRLVATGTHGGTTASGWKVWDSRTGELVKEFGDSAGFGTFSPDGRWLVNGNRVRVRRTDDWSDHPHFPESDVSVHCVFSPDSRLLAVGGQSAVRLLRMTDGAELVRLPYAEQCAILPLCFSPDGATLFAQINDTAEVMAWDLRRLRAGLAELGLDWDEPLLPPAPAPRPPPRVVFAGYGGSAFNLTPDDYRRSADALQEVLKADRLNPGAPSRFELTERLAWTLGTLGEWTKAEAAYRQALAELDDEPALRAAFADPRGAGLLDAVCHTMLRHGKVKEADAVCADYFTRAVKLVLADPAPDDPVRARWASDNTHRLAQNATLVATRLRGFNCWTEALAWADRVIDLWAAHADKWRDPTAAKRSGIAFRAYEEKAISLNWLNRGAEAVAALDEAMRISPDANKPYERMMRARYVAKAGDHAEAAKQVKAELAAGNTNTWDAAVAFAVCATAKTADDPTREAYAKEAVFHLRLTLSGNGVTQPWRSDPDLHPLRDRPDFKAVIAAHERRTSPASEKLPPLAVSDCRELHNADLDELKKWLAGLPKTHRPIHITPQEGSNGKRFDALAIDDGTGTGFEAHLALGPKEREKYGQDADDPAMWGKGWHRTWCNFYFVDGIGYRHHLWAKGTSHHSVWPQRDKLADGLAQLRTKKMRPISVIAYDGNLFLHGGPDDGLQWELYADLTAAQVKEKIEDARKRKWRPTLVHRHRDNTDQFVLVLVENPHDTAWEYHASLSLKEYEAKVAVAKARGLRPEYVHSWLVNKEPVYSVVLVGDYRPPPREVLPPPRADK